MPNGESNGHLGTKWITLLLIPGITVAVTVGTTLTLIGERQDTATAERSRIEAKITSVKEEILVRMREHSAADDLRWQQLNIDFQRHTERPAHEGARDRITRLEADEVWIRSKLEELMKRCPNGR